MTTIALRIAAPIQTWGQYRGVKGTTPTSGFPTKSGVAGLIAACLGTRDIVGVSEQFTLKVRVDDPGTLTSDFQVASPVPVTKRTYVNRRNLFPNVDGTKSINLFNGEGEGLTGVTSSGKEYSKALRHFGAGDQADTYVISERKQISGADFIVFIEVDNPEAAAAWVQAIQFPIYPPCLGRKANTPTWPLYLTTSELTAEALAQLIPTVQNTASSWEEIPKTTSLKLYTISGLKARNITSPPSEINGIPVVTANIEQVKLARLDIPAGRK